MAINKLGKEFTIELDNKTLTLAFHRPNQEELFQIDLVYRKIYSEALRARVMTEAEVKKVLRKNGSWTKADEDRISDLSFQIANLQGIVETLKESSSSDIVDVVSQITERRTELLDLIGQRTAMLSNSAEGIANEQRMHKFIELCCVRIPDKSRFFDDFDHYKQFVADNADVMSEIYKQAWLFEYAMDEDHSSHYPELQILEDAIKRENESKETDKPEQSEESKPKTTTRKRRTTKGKK